MAGKLRASDLVVLGAGALALIVSGVCIAALRFTVSSWIDVVETGILLGFLALLVIVGALTLYPLVKAEADCKRKECEETNEAGP